MTSWTLGGKQSAGSAVPGGLPAGWRASPRLSPKTYRRRSRLSDKRRIEESRVGPLWPGETQKGKFPPPQQCFVNCRPLNSEPLAAAPSLPQLQTGIFPEPCNGGKINPATSGSNAEGRRCRRPGSDFGRVEPHCSRGPVWLNGRDFPCATALEDPFKQGRSPFRRLTCRKPQPGTVSIRRWPG